jgi:hypothetical protein
MHWRTRMMAIVLAGGSITACSERADSTGVDGATPSRSAGSVPDPTVVTPLLELPLQDAAAQSPVYRIPRCNANPDPCCHDPTLPGCGVDGGDEAAVVDAAEEDAAVGDACSGGGAPPR